MLVGSRRINVDGVRIRPTTATGVGDSSTWSRRCTKRMRKHRTRTTDRQDTLQETISSSTFGGLFLLSKMQTGGILKWGEGARVYRSIGWTQGCGWRHALALLPHFTWVYGGFLPVAAHQAGPKLFWGGLLSCASLLWCPGGLPSRKRGVDHTAAAVQRVVHTMVLLSALTMRYTLLAALSRTTARGIF